VASIHGVRPQHAIHLSGAVALALAGNALRQTPPEPPTP
jgi:hypothetical protein